MLVLQVHRSDNLLELQNLLVFFDGLSPISGGAALYVCVIVFLSVCANDVRDVRRSVMFYRFCIVAILLCCAVASVSSLTML